MRYASEVRAVPEGGKHCLAITLGQLVPGVLTQFWHPELHFALMQLMQGTCWGVGAGVGNDVGAGVGQEGEQCNPVSCVLPGQLAPPLARPSQVRRRILQPPPHVFEHVLQALHAPHEPATGAPWTHRTGVSFQLFVLPKTDEAMDVVRGADEIAVQVFTEFVPSTFVVFSQPHRMFGTMAADDTGSQVPARP